MNNYPNLYFCSFADSSLLPSLRRIRCQAKQFNCFKEVFTYTEINTPPHVQNRINQIIGITGSKRGFGYWSWKPAVIMDVLQKIKEGDMLLYLDAGCHINENGKDKFFEYVNQAIAHDIWVTKLPDSHNDLAYTKNDTISLFKDNLPNEKVLREGQIQSGIILLVKNSYTSRIVQRWNELMNVNNIHYYDDSASRLPNDVTFIENRHDQSIFSLLLKSNHYTYDSNCRSWAATDSEWSQLAEVEPFLVKRDLVKKVRLETKIHRLIRRFVNIFNLHD